MSIRSSYPSITPSLSLDFAKSRRLDPRISFTRAQTGNIATYIGSDGLVKYAAPDEPRFDHRSTFRTNLIKYSEDLSQSNWALINTSGNLQKNSNVTSAPDGSLTADSIFNNTLAASGDSIYQDLGSISGTGTYTASIYLKSNNCDSISLRNFSLWNSITAYGITLNPITGQLISTVSGTTNVKITPVGGGWFRVSFTHTRTDSANTTLRFQIYMEKVGTLYIWGAQLEEGDTLTDYIATGPAAVTKTSVESLGLLVEESRTNLSLYSQDFTNNTSLQAWPVSPTTSRAYLVSNTGINDPSGGTTASRWASGTTFAEELIYHLLPSGLTIGSTYTASVWIRRVSGTGNVSLIVGDNSGSVVTSQVDSVPYGTWVRCSATRTVTGVNGTPSRAYILLYPDDAGNPTTIDIWGYQMEAGAFPTSYIPTSGTTITRPADAPKINLSTFPGVYNQNSGAFLVKSKIDCTLPANTYGSIFGAGAPGTGAGNMMNLNPSNAMGYYVSNLGQSPFASMPKIYVPGQSFKIATTYATDDFACSVNGDISTSTTSNALYKSHTQLAIGTHPFTNNVFGTQTISNVFVYSKRLSNSQLQTLTAV